jgi:hypothetical protein
MSGSSSSSPPCSTEVSSSRQPQATGCDKTVGSISRQAAPPVREDQRTVCPRAVPSGMGASESQRSAPRQVDPPRRSEERPAPTRQLCDGSDRPDSDSLQRRRSRGRSSDSASTLSAPAVVEPSAAPRRLQPLLIRGSGALDVHVSLVTGGGHGPTPTVAKAGDQPPSKRGRVLPPVRRRDEAEQPPRRQAQSAQPPSRRARSAQPPSRARWTARRRKPGCAPRCKPPTSDLLYRDSSDLICLLTLVSVFS